MNRTITAISLCLAGLAAVGQIHVDKPIVLTGAGQIERQVAGLPDTTTPDAVISAATATSGHYRTVTPQNGNDWSVSLPALGEDAPAAGLHVVVIVPVVSAGPLTVTINGDGPYPIEWNGTPVDGVDLSEGALLSLVLDGTNMQVINGMAQRKRSCPTDMVAVSEQFCIEPVERGASDLFTAFVACGSIGRRLCSWSEFVVACTNASQLGLSGMTSNWEWTNNACNEDGSARIVGAVGCESSTARIGTQGGTQYRCCSTR